MMKWGILKLTLSSRLKRTVLRIFAGASVFLWVFVAGKAYAQRAPGGVSDDLNFWIRADKTRTIQNPENGESVSSWKDHSPSNILLISSCGPILKESILNFNPTVYFNGAAYLGTSDTLKDVVTVFAVSRLESGNVGFILSERSTDSRLGAQGWFFENEVMKFDQSQYFGRGGVSTVNGKVGAIHSNKHHIASVVSNNGLGTDWKRLSIGIKNPNANLWDGHISEILAFGKQLSGEEFDKVYSYLAMKYGVTLEKYILSNGNAVYRATDNSKHGTQQHVFALAKDTSSDLFQWRARSLTDTSLSMWVGATEITDQAPDRDRISGNPILGTTAKWGIALASNGRDFYRVSSNIKQQTFNLNFRKRVTDAAAAALYDTLYVISDPTLIIGADGKITYTRIAATVKGEVTGNEIIYRNIAINEGNFIAFKKPSAGPGGVSSGLSLWLDAGEGISTTGGEVVSWEDEKNNLRFTSLAGVRATFNDNLWVYRPAIQLEDGDELSSTVNIASVKTAFAVTRLNEFQGNAILLRGKTGTPVWTSSASKLASYLATSDDQLGTGGQFFINGGSTAVHAGKPHIVNVLDKSTTPTRWDSMRIGHSTGGWRGNIAEIITYEEELSALEREKVNSYLAMKYGITLRSGNYILSSGDTSWARQEQTSWGTEAGIVSLALDIGAGLYQWRGYSLDDPSVKAWLGQGDITGTAPDKNNLPNNSRLSGRTFAIVLSRNSSGLYRVSSRQERQVTINLAKETTRTEEFDTLYVMSDPTIETSSSGKLSYRADRKVPGLVSDGKVVYRNLVLNDGEYFAFGAPAKSPGGATAELALWLRADKKVSATGTKVTSWENYSTSNVQTTVRGELTVKEIGDNFNPTISFVSASPRIEITPAISMGAFFMVLQDAHSGSRPNQEYISGSTGDFGAGTDTWAKDRINALSGQWAFNGRIGDPLTEKRTVRLSLLSNVMTGLNTVTANSISSNDDAVSWRGLIPEAIAFKESLSAEDRVKVESYLAIKYGLTLETGDYLLSDGDTLWDRVQNVGYSKNVVALVRDDISDLWQWRGNSLNDNDFQIWVAEGQRDIDASTAPSKQLAGFPSSPAWGFALSRKDGDARVWRVSSTENTSLNINVKYPDLKSVEVSSNPNFTSARTVAATNEQVTITIEGGDYIRLNLQTATPGGAVAQVNLWLRADRGIRADGGKVIRWNERSGKAIPFEANIGDAPTFKAEHINYNPAVDFAGIKSLVTTESLDKTISAFAVVNVATSTAIHDGVLLSGSVSGTALRNSAPHWKVEVGTDRWTQGRDGGTLGFGGTVNVNESNPASLSHNNKYHIVAINDPDSTTPVRWDSLAIGLGGDASNSGWEGEVAEIITYNTTLTASDSRNVVSYLALKYGITLETGNYILSSSTLWDRTTNSGYTKNIFGIVRNDVSDLWQWRGRPLNDKGLSIWIDEGQGLSGVAPSKNSLTKNAVVNDSTAWSVLLSQKDDGAREWRVSISGLESSNEVTVGLADKSMIKVAVLDAGRVSLREYDVKNGVVTGVVLRDGYFLRATSKAPANIASGLVAWFSADEKITLTGGNVNAWANLASQSDILTSPRASNPTYATKSLNGNPVVKFSGTSWLASRENLEAKSIFAVAHPTGSGEILFAASDGSGNAVAPYLRRDGLNLDSWKNDESSDIGNGGMFYLNQSVSELRHNNEPHLVGVTDNSVTPNAWNSYSIGAVNRGWTGDLAELIIYDRIVNSEERLKLSSYLATKYGITLTTGSYQFAGNTLWDRNDNTGVEFQDRIIGVVYDTSQPFMQRTATSSLDGSFAVLTAEEDLGAQEGLFLSENDSALGWEKGILSIGNEELLVSKRKWRVSEKNGDVGTIRFEIVLSRFPRPVVLPSKGEELKLLKGTLRGMDVVYSEVVQPTVNGDTISYRLNPSDGDIFAFATKPVAGGVVGVKFWLAADSYQNNTINDYALINKVKVSGKDTLLPGIGGNTPTYNASPYMKKRAVVGANDGWREGAVFNGERQEVFVVYHHKGQGEGTVYESEGVTTIGLNSNLRVTAGGNEISRRLPVFPTGGIPVVYRTAFWTSTQDTVVSGVFGRSGIPQQINPVSTGGFSIMSNLAGTKFADGDFYEAMLFNEVLSDEERDRVMTYLSLKYGLAYTSGTNSWYQAENIYRFGNGGVLWDPQKEGDYTYLVSGLINDPSQKLKIEENQSFYDTSILKIRSIKSANIPNYSALVWSTDLAGYGLKRVSSSNRRLQRLEQLWKVREIGNVDSVELGFSLNEVHAFSIPDELERIVLIVDRDEDFSTSHIVLPKRTIPNGDSIFFTVDFQDGEYFTLARIASPLGLNVRTALWLRSDLGVLSQHVRGRPERDVLAMPRQQPFTEGEIFWRDMSGLQYDTVAILKTTTDAPPRDRDVSIGYQKDSLFNAYPYFDITEAESFFGYLEKRPVRMSGITSFIVAEAEGTGDYFLENGIFTIAQNSAVNNNNNVLDLTEEILPAAQIQATTVSGYNPLQSINGAGTTMAGKGKISLFSSFWNANSNSFFLNGTLAETLQQGLGDGGLQQGIIGSVYALFGRFQSNTDGGIDAGNRGKLAEVIMFPSELSTEDRRKVEVYLSLKYSLTFAQGALPYISANNDTLWKPEENPDNRSGIFGVFRDDQIGIDQVTSFSDGIILSDASDLGDGEAMVLAHNGLVDSFVALENDATLLRWARTWRVSERVGDVGDVGLFFDMKKMPFRVRNFLNREAIYVDDNGDGNFSDAKKLAATWRNDSLFLNVPYNFPNGALIALATKVPARVANVEQVPKLWLRSDNSVDTAKGKVHTWRDLVYTNAAARAEGNVLWGRDSLNFFPKVSTTTKGIVQGTLADTLRGREFSLMLVTSIPQNTKTHLGGVLSLRGDGANKYDTLNDGLLLSFKKRDELEVKIGRNWKLTANVLDIYVSDLVVEITRKEDSVTLFINGTKAASRYLSKSAPPLEAKYYALNGRANSNGITQRREGALAEVIFFRTALSADDKKKLESYLGLRYGIPMYHRRTPYYAGIPTAGTEYRNNNDEIWSAVDPFHYEPYGFLLNRKALQEPQSIGEDTFVSSTLHPGLSPVISIAKADAWQLGDNEVAIISHTNDKGLTASGVSNELLRWNRVWQLTRRSGEVLGISVELPTDLLDLPTNSRFVKKAKVLIDKDEDGAYEDVQDMTQAGHGYRLEDVPFEGGANNDRFTFAFDMAVPGGVGEGLAAWLEPDWGTVLKGDEITKWVDVSMNGMHFESPQRYREQDTFPVIFGGDSRLSNFHRQVAFNMGVPAQSQRTQTLHNVQNILSDSTYVLWIVTRAGGGVVFSAGTKDSAYVALGYVPTDPNDPKKGIKEVWYRHGSDKVSVNVGPSQLRGTLMRPLLQCVRYQEGKIELTVIYDNQQKTNSSNTKELVINERIEALLGGNVQSDRAEADKYKGYIGDFALYLNSQRGNEELKVRSYLALKYGITSRDRQGGSEQYWASKEKIFDDGSDYVFNIIGVGKDDKMSFDAFKSYAFMGNSLFELEVPQDLLQDGQFIMLGTNGEKDTAGFDTLKLGVNVDIEDTGLYYKQKAKIQMTNLSAATATLRVLDWQDGFYDDVTTELAVDTNEDGNWDVFYLASGVTTWQPEPGAIARVISFDGVPLRHNFFIGLRQSVVREHCIYVHAVDDGSYSEELPGKILSLDTLRLSEDTIDIKDARGETTVGRFYLRPADGNLYVGYRFKDERIRDIVTVRIEGRNNAIGEKAWSDIIVKFVPYSVRDTVRYELVKGVAGTDKIDIISGVDEHFRTASDRFFVIGQVTKDRKQLNVTNDKFVLTTGGWQESLDGDTGEVVVGKDFCTKNLLDTTVVIFEGRDYGDAYLNGFAYGADSEDSIAYHVTSSQFYLGDTVDFELPGVLTNGSMYDDNNGLSDDDALHYKGFIDVQAPTELKVVFKNPLRKRAYLNLYIDYNKNGSFADAGESIHVDKLTTTFTRSGDTLSLTVPTPPAAALLGRTVMRLRLSDRKLGPNGWFGKGGVGEIEDYSTAVAPPSTQTDTVLVPIYAGQYLAKAEIPTHPALLPADNIEVGWDRTDRYGIALAMNSTEDTLSMVTSFGAAQFLPDTSRVIVSRDLGGGSVLSDTSVFIYFRAPAQYSKTDSIWRGAKEKTFLGTGRNENNLSPVVASELPVDSFKYTVVGGAVSPGVVLREDRQEQGLLRRLRFAHAGTDEEIRSYVVNTISVNRFFTLNDSVMRDTVHWELPRHQYKPKVTFKPAPVSDTILLHVQNKNTCVVTLADSLVTVSSLSPFTPRITGVRSGYRLGQEAWRRGEPFAENRTLPYGITKLFVDGVDTNRNYRADSVYLDVRDTFPVKLVATVEDKTVKFRVSTACDTSLTDTISQVYSSENCGRLIDTVYQILNMDGTKSAYSKATFPRLSIGKTEIRVGVVLDSKKDTIFDTVFVFVMPAEMPEVDVLVKGYEPKDTVFIPISSGDTLLRFGLNTVKGLPICSYDTIVSVVSKENGKDMLQQNGLTADRIPRELRLPYGNYEFIARIVTSQAGQRYTLASDSLLLTIADTIPPVIKKRVPFTQLDIAIYHGNTVSYPYANLLDTLYALEEYSDNYMVKDTVVEIFDKKLKVKKDLFKRTGQIARGEWKVVVTISDPFGNKAADTILLRIVFLDAYLLLAKNDAGYGLIHGEDANTTIMGSVGENDWHEKSAIVSYRAVPIGGESLPESFSMNSQGSYSYVSSEEGWKRVGVETKAVTFLGAGAYDVDTTVLFLRTYKHSFKSEMKPLTAVVNLHVKEGDSRTVDIRDYAHSLGSKLTLELLDGNKDPVSWKQTVTMATKKDQLLQFYVRDSEGRESELYLSARGVSEDAYSFYEEMGFVMYLEDKVTFLQRGILKRDSVFRRGNYTNELGNSANVLLPITNDFEREAISPYGGFRALSNKVQTVNVRYVGEYNSGTNTYEHSGQLWLISFPRVDFPKVLQSMSVQYLCDNLDLRLSLPRLFPTTFKADQGDGGAIVYRIQSLPQFGTGTFSLKEDTLVASYSYLPDPLSDTLKVEIKYKNSLDSSVIGVGEVVFNGLEDCDCRVEMFRLVSPGKPSKVTGAGCYESNNLTIYARYGGVVFSAKDVRSDFAWDGSYSPDDGALGGEKVPTGIYWYVFEAQGAKKGYFSGWITVITE